MTDNMAHAHCALDTKAADTHSECVILIAFPPQQWLDGRVIVTLYIHCLSCLLFKSCWW